MLILESQNIRYQRTKNTDHEKSNTDQSYRSESIDLYLISINTDDLLYTNTSYQIFWLFNF